MTPKHRLMLIPLSNAKSSIKIAIPKSDFLVVKADVVSAMPGANPLSHETDGGRGHFYGDQPSESGSKRHPLFYVFERHYSVKLW